jgi:hypothetical protein
VTTPGKLIEEQAHTLIQYISSWKGPFVPHFIEHLFVAQFVSFIIMLISQDSRSIYINSSKIFLKIYTINRLSPLNNLCFLILT